MPFRYMPVLRTKTGESTALHHLDAATKARLMPLVRITRALPAAFGPSVSASFTGLPLALDGDYNTRESGSVATFSNLYRQLGANGVRLIPAISMTAKSCISQCSRALEGPFLPRSCY